MYKIMVIEDEPTIRKSISMDIPWNKIDCEVINCAASSEEGLKKIEENPNNVDIIVTDIRMGEISGLDLSEIVANEYPSKKVVIVTGYGDINYAKRAIKTNVVDFILKPVDPEELINAVKEAVNQIEIAKRKEENLDALKKQIMENKPLLKKHYINYLLEHSKNSMVESNEDKERYLEIDFSSYYINAVSFDNYIHIPKNKYVKTLYEYKAAIETLIEAICKNNCDYCVQHGEDNKMLCILFGINHNKMEELTESLSKKAFDLYDISISQGISQRGKGSKSVYKYAAQASDALKYGFYFGERAIVLYDEISRYKRTNNIPIEDKLYKETLEYVYAGNTIEALRHFDRIWHSINTVVSEEKLKELCISIIREYYKISSEYNLSIEELVSWNDMRNVILNITTIKTLYQYIRNYTYLISNSIQKSYITSNSQVVSRIEQLIEDRYMTNLTLADVAEHVEMSEKYICKLLKKETEKTFKEIVSEKRIKHAIELMNTTNLKNYEIAEKVGYTDSRYFGQLFKKITGITPREYRRNESEAKRVAIKISN